MIAAMTDVGANLKDPLLVARIQNYFGVYRTDSLPQQVKGVISNGFRSDLKEGLASRNGMINKRRHPSPLTTSSDSETDDSESERFRSQFVVRKKFWYYFFSFGASLGYELFYCSFFPFWFWNIDSAVCRRVIVVWSIVMYVGQSLKDIIRWPRPAQPPVIQLEPGYSQEYGMPSTHAMAGAAVPFSLLAFTMHRYEYPFAVGLMIACAWCTLVCASRLYLGMHTVLDIIGGLVLVGLLLAVLWPCADAIDHFQLTYRYSPLVIMSLLVCLTVFYPKSDRWTPARGDSAVILGTGGGVSLGSWLNYQLGIIRGPGLPPPYRILWPDYGVTGLALLRASIGILCIVAARAFFRSAIYAVVCTALRVSPRDLKTEQRSAVEIPYKFISYGAIGFVITYLAPIVFRFLNIERITMFTEV